MECVIKLAIICAIHYQVRHQPSNMYKNFLRVMTSTSHCFSRLAHRMRSFSSISSVPASLNTRNGVLSWMYLACCSTKATRGTRKTISLSLECSRAEIHLMRSNPMSVFPDPVLRAAITFSTFIQDYSPHWLKVQQCMKYLFEHVQKSPLGTCVAGGHGCWVQGRQ